MIRSELKGEFYSPSLPSRQPEDMCACHSNVQASCCCLSSSFFPHLSLSLYLHLSPSLIVSLTFSFLHCPSSTSLFLSLSISIPLSPSFSLLFSHLLFPFLFFSLSISLLSLPFSFSFSLLLSFLHSSCFSIYFFVSYIRKLDILKLAKVSKNRNTPRKHYHHQLLDQKHYLV